MGKRTIAIKISSDQLTEFDRVFNLFDANGDGSLTHQEIQEALEVLGGGISAHDRTKLLDRINDVGIVNDCTCTCYRAVC